MNRFDIDNLVAQLQSGDLSRRGFMRRATALGVSAAAAGMMASNVLAQGSTPSPEVATPDLDNDASPVGGTG